MNLFQETERAKGQVKKAMTVLDNYLQIRTYLVGERISQADISVACNLLSLYKYVSSKIGFSYSTCTFKFSLLI
jgi:elongation factor 1-gamma